MAHVDHEHAAHEAEACFKEIAAKPNERTALLCESAATIFNRYAQTRVESVKVIRDIGPLENDLFSLRWDWLMPLTLANLDDSEEKSIETTLTGRILYWVGEAFEKVTGGAGSSSVPESIQAQGDSEAIAAPAQTAGIESNAESVANKASERHAFMVPHLAPIPGKPNMNGLADETGIGQSSLSRWYNGHTSLGDINLGYLAGHLNVPPETIPN